MTKTYYVVSLIIAIGCTNVKDCPCLSCGVVIMDHLLLVAIHCWRANSLLESKFIVWNDYISNW